MLSKYSYAMLIGALFVASMTVAQVRSAIFAKGWWLAPLMGTLIFAPHASWLASHWGMAAGTVQKMSISTEASHLNGLGNLFKALLYPRSMADCRISQLSSLQALDPAPQRRP